MKRSFKIALVAGTAACVCVAAALVMAFSLPWERTNTEHVSPAPARADSGIAMKYHEKTKHTYAELMSQAGGLDWAKMPSVFKEYPRAELIKLSDNVDFPGISVEEAIELGPYTGGFSGEPVTKDELSKLLYHTDGVTKVVRSPGMTYYFRAAPSAGALYPRVIYLAVNNVKGLKKGIYHYSVKDHGLHLLQKGDFTEKLASLCNGSTLIKKASAVFIISTIFYRTKWKYRERGYRYVLLDTGHAAENLTLTARALGLGSYSIGTFLDDGINGMLGIDGIKEAVVYINAIGKKAAGEDTGGSEDRPLSPSEASSVKRLEKGLSIAELMHESGKLGSLKETGRKTPPGKETTYKSYPEAKMIRLPGRLSKQGMDVDNAIRKRRSVREYSGKPMSKLELSRLLYSAYGRIKDKVPGRAVWSIEGLYPIEVYAVVNNVEGIKPGVYHYNVPEHSLELLDEGDYRSRIVKASLGQRFVGNANVAIIQTAVFDRVKSYGDRGYRYTHLDSGAIGENIYLEAASLGLGACGVGAFFDDKVNNILGIDGINEAAIYITSVGK